MVCIFKHQINLWNYVGTRVEIIKGSSTNEEIKIIKEFKEVYQCGRCGKMIEKELGYSNKLRALIAP